GWAVYQTVRQGDVFVVDPVELVTPGQPVPWTAAVRIVEAGAPPVEGRFGVYVYPARRDTPRFFPVASVLLPILALGVFGLVATLRRAPWVVDAPSDVPS